MRKRSVRWALAGGIAVAVIGFVVYGMVAAYQGGMQDQVINPQPTTNPSAIAVEKGVARDIDSATNGPRTFDDGGASMGAGAPEQFADAKSNYGGAAVSSVALSKPAIPSIDEKIVRTANLELQVKKGKFDGSYERAIASARKAGGYVSQSKSAATGEAIASGEIMMRIPAQDFETVLSELKKLGKVKSVDISSEDVSDEYVDLKSRLRNWRAQQAVMLGLMKKAATIQESITIQNNLSDIQMEIERISGRLTFLDNRTSYATIRLYMAEPQVIVRAQNWGLGDAVRSALHASAKMLSIFVVLLGYLVPLAALTGTGYALYRVIMGARRRDAVQS
ncbi:MAG: DUF4349 domain-containing protein [Candidatus Aquicultor sp.]